MAFLGALPAGCPTPSVFRGNLEHTGVHAAAPVEHFGKIKWKKIKWKFPTEVGVASSPAVDHGSVCFGGDNGNFYALDGATGVLQWKFRTAGERRFTATRTSTLTWSRASAKCPAWVPSWPRPWWSAASFTSAAPTAISYVLLSRERFSPERTLAAKRMPAFGFGCGTSENGKSSRSRDGRSSGT